ncbi:uncharacterized protein si:dkey-1h6.8 [Megalops cyprinoides]|uniref:uncharacterized protein si:dkey-1h6.8 n=1 Tax=Megalops cyprinoides TaxID=118141 RepID=UPI001864DFB6|nr:uncharacterized protein si:dkey-1h6.8 [Megalops cyprinoides]
MSVQEVQVGQEKVGLKRKLTGPPRLLLGKFRAKNQGENKIDGQAGIHSGVGDNNGMQGTTQDTPVDNGSLLVAVGDVQKPQSEQPETESEEAPANVFAGASGISSTSEENEVKGDPPGSGDTAKRRTGKTSWKQFWSPSLLCVKRQRNDPCGDGITGDTCQKRQTGCATKRAAGNSADPKDEQCDGETAHCHTDARSQRSDAFSAGTWATFRRLLMEPHGPRKPKEGRLEQAVPGREDKKRPKASFKKRVGRFFKRDGKKSLQGVDGSPQEPLGEDTTGLPGRPADHGQAAPATQEVDGLEADCHIRGSRSETLTVSVEVSAERAEGTEESDTAEASGKCLRRRKDEEECGGCPKEGVERNDRILKTDNALKNSGLTPVMEEPHTFGEDSNLSTDVGEEAGVKSLEGVVRAETDRIPEEAAMFEKGAIEENDCCYKISQERHMQDFLPLNTEAHNGIDLVRCYRTEIDGIVRNGPLVHTPEAILLPDLSVDEGMPCRETLLVQTACSVVKAAVKAALDQLRAEDDGTASSVHRGAQESQGHH